MLIDAIAFLLAHKGDHSRWLAISHAPLNQDDLGSSTRLMELSFVSDKWWPLVTGNKDRGTSFNRVDRRYFELCVFTNVMLELKSGDLAVCSARSRSNFEESETDGWEIVGWDPDRQQIRSWIFDSNGGFGESVWANDGGLSADGTQWISCQAGFLPVRVLSRLYRRLFLEYLVKHALEKLLLLFVEAVRFSCDEAPLNPSSR